VGYSTQFEGVLKFTADLPISQIGRLKGFLGEDCRNHPEWGSTHLTYINLEIADDFSGLQWDGSEKSYEMEEKINLIISNMRKEYPDFALTGKLQAQGDDFDDRWVLTFDDNGKAIRQNLVIVGEIIECPHCGEKFEKEER
jgi:hypothetical protein